MNTNSEQPQPIQDDDFSHEIIGAAVEVQRVLGVGLLEGAYASALAIELAERELGFQRDVPMSAQYKGHDLGVVFRADFIVEGSVIVGLLPMDAAADQHRAQLLSALRLSNVKLGLLINFHAFPVVKGIHRVVNRISGERQ